jgi:hypothetical protein
MSKKYTITVLVGTVYTAEVEAENFDPYDAPEWDEVEADRTVIIGHSHGYTAFGFGVETAILGVRS